MARGIDAKELELSDELDRCNDAYKMLELRHNIQLAEMEGFKKATSMIVSIMVAKLRGR